VNSLLWALVVLVPALQVPGVLLFSRYVDAEEELGWEPGYAHHARASEPDAPNGVAVCRRCGKSNDERFARCGSCAARLR
jgi:hypothetical protein